MASPQPGSHIRRRRRASIPPTQPIPNSRLGAPGSGTLTGTPRSVTGVTPVDNSPGTEVLVPPPLLGNGFGCPRVGPELERDVPEGRPVVIAPEERPVAMEPEGRPVVIAPEDEFPVVIEPEEELPVGGEVFVF